MKPTDAPPLPAPDSHVVTGVVLWTMSKGDGLARARCWRTAEGFELEVQLWHGAAIDGQEDLVWAQRFPSEPLVNDAALGRKHQLQAMGWVEDPPAR